VRQTNRRSDGQTDRQTAELRLPRRANIASSRGKNGSPYAIRPLSVMSCLSCLSACNVGVLWPNSSMDQDATWHAGRPRPFTHCVRWGPSSHYPKGTQPPNFRPISVLAKWLDGLRCHLVWRPEPRRLCVRWRPSSSFPQNEAEPPIFGPCLL